MTEKPGKKGTRALRRERSNVSLAISPAAGAAAPTPWPRLGSIAMVTGFGLASLSQTVTVGADTMWLVALGRTVLSEGKVPDGVPFLSADTSEWANVAVLGQILMALIDKLGPGALLVAQLLAVALALLGLVASSRRLGASDFGISWALMAFLLGQLPSLGVVRAQMWSIPLLVLMAYLLRRESERPSRRIWLVAPLVVLWGNLHGAVLVGVAVAVAYLALKRGRQDPLLSVGVAAFALLGLWATPAGLASHEYYLGVLGNEAALRGEGLWAPLDLGSGFDWLMFLSTVVLLVASLRRGVPLWEYAVVAGLVFMTLQAARNGIWLALWLVPRASIRLRGSRASHLLSVFPAARLIKPVAGLALVGIASAGLIQRAHVVETDRAVARQLAGVIGSDRSTLAVSPMSELLAVEGVPLWAGNPIDALPRERQVAFLDFLSGRYESITQAVSPPEVLVIRSGDASPQGYRLVAVEAGYQVFRRNLSRPSPGAHALGALLQPASTQSSKLLPTATRRQVVVASALASGSPDRTSAACTPSDSSVCSQPAPAAQICPNISVTLAE